MGWSLATRPRPHGDFRLIVVAVSLVAGGPAALLCSQNRGGVGRPQPPRRLAQPTVARERIPANRTRKARKTSPSDTCVANGIASRISVMARSTAPVVPIRLRNPQNVPLGTLFIGFPLDVTIG